MTLNQIIARIKTIALQHRQIKRCEYGERSDILTNKTGLYGLLWVQADAMPIDVTGRQTSVTLVMFFLDLVNVSSDAESNLLDVQSDMLSVAQDIIAKINHSSYTDWKIEGISNARAIYDEENDVCAGVAVTLTISTPYEQDVCAVPEIEPADDTVIEWGWFTTDPYSDIEDAEFQFSKEVQNQIPSYTLEFTENANGQYIAVKEPSAQPEKSTWFNTEFNQGTFPDQVFRTPVIIAGYRYYVSRKKVVLQDIVTEITFSE